MTNPATSITTLLFDWDGTLNDSARSGFRAFQKSLEELGVVFTEEFYEANYTPNWYAMYELLELPRTSWEEADRLWLHHYGSEPASLVEGALETVLELDRRGYLLGIVSSGSLARVAREIAESGLGTVFRVAVCNEHMTNKKPHPEGLLAALRELGSERRASAYIGDVPGDIEMGKSAGVYTIGVKSGYPSSRHLKRAEPDICLDTISELLLHFPTRALL